VKKAPLTVEISFDHSNSASTKQQELMLLVLRRLFIAELIPQMVELHLDGNEPVIACLEVLRPDQATFSSLRTLHIHRFIGTEPLPSSNSYDPLPPT
jgi:hypothetical protein